MSFPYQPRQKIDQYEILCRLPDSQGCQRYLAQDWQQYRQVVLKIPNDACVGGRTIVERLEQESRLHQHLSHSAFQHALPKLDPSSQPYLVLEDLHCPTLREVMAQRKPSHLEEEEALAIMAGVCEALTFLHTQGVVHGDLKPEHILLPLGEAVRLTGLGLSKPSSIRRRCWRELGFPVGTPDYLAPERWWGHPTSESSDIYAVGIILYELLSGSPPFGSTRSYRFLVPQLATDPPNLLEVCPDVRPELATVVMRAIRRKPARRYPSSEELRTDLLHLEHVTPTRYVPEPSAWGGKYRLVLFILLLSLLGCLGLVALGLLAQFVQTGRW